MFDYSDVQIAEAEKKQALSEVSFKTMERRLETEAEEKSKINAEVNNTGIPYFISKKACVL